MIGFVDELPVVMTFFHGRPGIDVKVPSLGVSLGHLAQLLVGESEVFLLGRRAATEEVLSQVRHLVAVFLRSHQELLSQL